MTAPKVGDRVRVVLEGTVQQVAGSRVTLADKDFYFPGKDVVSIEVIEPPFVIPTKKWAQVVSGSGDLFTRMSDNLWRDIDGLSYANWEMDDIPGLRVISDGVDE
jgi:hypothetical protein